MPLPLIFAPAGVATVAVTKRAQNRRKQAAANEFSKKYPLADDVNTLDGYIRTAEIELKNIKSAPAETAAIKRVKARNSQALTKWIGVMKEQRRDLSVGINVASTVAAPVPAPVEVAATEVVNKTEVAATPEVENVNVSETPKKGVNWLLIGGVAVGAVIVYKLLKK